MSERRFRKPNALKHGAFSGHELLPWEDVNEYEDLRRGLFSEHQPEGPLQEDCVNTVLTNLWRKRRVRAKRNFDIGAALDKVENRVLWEEPLPIFGTELGTIKQRLAAALDRPRPKERQETTGPPDDYSQLMGFSSSLYEELEGSLLELKISMLPPEFRAHLNENVPSEKFEYHHQWVIAVKKEVDGFLLPMVRSRAPQPEAYNETAAGFLTTDRVLEDLETEERLDAAIDRALKRLYQLKMASQLYAPKQPKLIEDKSPHQIEHRDAKRRTGGE
jgi:hypothetical protein